MTGHEPTMNAAGEVVWASCSCRWVSPAYLDETKASAAWAIHEQEARSDA